MMNRATHLLIALCCTILIPPAAADRVERLLKQGNELFEAGQYDQALQLYQEAEKLQAQAKQDGETPIVHYNIGDTLYRQGEYEQAAQRFQQTKAGFRQNYSQEYEELLRSSQYNMGCALYRQGNNLAEKNDLQAAVEKLEASVNAFRDGLLEYPDDNDMKHNFAIAKRRLEELKQQMQKQQQQQNQQNKQNQQQQDRQQQQNQDQQQQSDQNQQNQSDQQQQQQQNQNKDQQEQQQDQQQQKQDQSRQSQSDREQQQQQQQSSPQQSEEDISKEMARQILQSMFEEQKPEDYKRLYRMRGRSSSPERDW